MPERTCIGCRKTGTQDDFIRLSYYDGKMSVSSNNLLPGRGAYLCYSMDCFEKALKKNSFSRAFRTNISMSEIEECRKSFMSLMEEGK